MAPLNIDDLPEPDDGLSGWHFDPSSPPSNFTKAMIGRMSIADINRLSDRETSPLDGAQQESFDVAKSEYSADFKGRVERATRSMMANISANMDRTIANAMPKLPTTKEMLGFDTKKLMQVKVPSVLAPQFDAARQNLIADLTNTMALTSSPLAPNTQQQAERAEAQEPTQGDDAQRESHKRPSEKQAAPTLATDDALDTLNERLATIERHTEQVSMIAALARVMTSQAQISARGSVFYILVGVATTLGGISTLMGLESPTQKGVAVAITAGVRALAGISYFMIRWSQKRDLKAGGDTMEQR